MLLDQNVCDGPLPLAKMSPSPVVAPIAPPAPSTHEATWKQRLDALTTDALASLDLRADHDAPDFGAIS